MEERAAIPVSLPVSHPTSSYWQNPPSPLALHGAATPLPAAASIVVLGSGITGAMTAFESLSLDPSLSIVMLEARTACSGATGRNGGHTKSGAYRSYLENKHTLGTEEACKILRFEYACMRAVHEFSRNHKIASDSWEGDTVDVIHDKVQWDVAKRSIEALVIDLGPDDPASKYELWNSEETERLFHAPGSFGSVSYPAGSLSSYKFTIGVLDLAIKKGLQLFTETPATKLVRNTSVWQVHTPRGVVYAERVVMATNGYTARIWPPLQGIIVPLRGLCTAQRRGASMPEPDPPRTYSFIYSEGYEYMIQRPPGSSLAGDVIIGGGLNQGRSKGLLEVSETDDSAVDPTIIAYLSNCTPRYFGSSWGADSLDGRVRNSWSGVMGYSPDSRPLVGEVPGYRGLFLAASFQGHGMVLALLCAKALAAIVHGRDEEALREWFPDAFRVTPGRLTKKFQGLQHMRTVHVTQGAEATRE